MTTPYPTVRTPRCATCSHPKSEHRMELKKQACGRGCQIPELACPCEQYRERPQMFNRNAAEEQK